MPRFQGNDRIAVVTPVTTRHPLRAGVRYQQDRLGEIATSFRLFGFELQGRCSAFTSWRARKRDPKTFSLAAHNQELVLRHMTFGLQQLFQISLERGLCFNHGIERLLHLGRQIICIDVLPLQFFPCLSLADYWNERIEDWTYVSGGPFASQYGVDGYYVRIGPAAVQGGLCGRVNVTNRWGHSMPAIALIGMEYLHLARLGPTQPR